MFEEFWEKVDAASDLLDVDDSLMTRKLQECLDETQKLPEDLHNSDYFHLQGYISYAMRPQQLAQAQRYLRKSLELDPSNAYSRLYLGHCHYDGKVYQLAKDDFHLVDKESLPDYLQMKVDEMILCCKLRLSGLASGDLKEVHAFLKEYAPQNYREDYPFELYKTLKEFGMSLDEEEAKVLKHL